MTQLSTARYKPGDVICEEKESFVHVVYEDVKGKVCDSCIFKQENLKKCSGCKHMYYCSEECQRKDWRFAHKYECRNVYAVNFEELTSAISRLLFRLYNVLQNNKGLAAQKANDLTGMAFKDLPWHCEQFVRNEDKMLDFAAICYSFDTFKIKYNRAIMFEYYCKLQVHATYFVNRFNNGNHFFLYLSLAAFKHSCVPNAFFSISETRMILRAIKEINVGDEIVVSLIELNQDLEGRQKQLKEKYLPECACERCTSDFDKEFDYERLEKLLKERETSKHDNLIPRDSTPKLIFGEQLYKLENEILTMYKKVYGDYHPRITEIYLCMAKNLYCMKSHGGLKKLGVDLDQFMAEAREQYEVTFPDADEKFEKIQEYFSSLKVVPTNLTSEQSMLLSLMADYFNHPISNNIPS